MSIGYFQYLTFTWWFYTRVLLIYWYVFLLMMFSTSWCSRLETFMVYSVRSLSMLYTHSLPPSLSLLFKLGIVASSTALVPPNFGGNLSALLSFRLIFPLDNPLDEFHNVIYLDMIFIWFYGTIYVMFYTEIYWCWYVFWLFQKGYVVLFAYKLLLFTRGFSLFFKWNSIEILVEFSVLAKFCLRGYTGF